jgi:2-dehydropantoate 2-reductase
MSTVAGNTRILVVGAGATGGYFGGRLAEAGRDVTFLLRAARAAQLARDGLQIVSEHGDLTIRPKVVTAAEISGTYDLIVLSVKAYGLEQAMVDLAPAVGAGTLILPLLNGLRHIDLLVEKFGQQAVLGGICVVSSTLDERGRVVQLAGMQELTYGDRNSPDSRPENLRSVDRALQGAGFTARITDRVMAAMWQKWIMLSSLGAMNCLMRGTVGEIIAAPAGLAFAQNLLGETAAVAAAAGHPLSEPAQRRISALMTEPGSSFTSSMFRDLQAGRRVEVDAIIGDLVSRAEQSGVATPLLRLALTNLAIYQGRQDSTAR